MMITWRGKRCNDCCPFFELWVSADREVRFHNPQCRLSGHKDETGKVLDIRLELSDSGPTGVVGRPKNCPFEDPHGVHVEVHNDQP